MAGIWSGRKRVNVGVRESYGLARNEGFLSCSLRSKRFHLVSEQRKTEERDSRFWPREKWNKSQKMKVGGGGGEGRKLPFFPNPSPLFYLRHFSRGLWLSFLVLCFWTARKRLLRRWPFMRSGGLIRYPVTSFHDQIVPLNSQFVPQHSQKFSRLFKLGAKHGRYSCVYLAL